MYLPGDGNLLLVPVVTLSSIFQAIPDTAEVVLLKTDMQGFDFEAIKGAAPVLKKRVTHIITAVWYDDVFSYHAENDFCRDWLPFMTELGYRLLKYTEFYSEVSAGNASMAKEKCKGQLKRRPLRPKDDETAGLVEGDAYWVRVDAVGIPFPAVQRVKQFKPKFTDYDYESCITHVNGPHQSLAENILSFEERKQLFVLTTGERSFQKPAHFSVDFVHATRQTGAIAATFDAGYGPQKWWEGSRSVAEGHVTIWKRIAAECLSWCFVSEDDAVWPHVPLPAMPKNAGFVSYFRDGVCDAATEHYSQEYRRITQPFVKDLCMPFGAVAYALTGSFARTLLDALPMNKPIDHFLLEQAIKHRMAFVARNFTVKHRKGKSLRVQGDGEPAPRMD